MNATVAERQRRYKATWRSRTATGDGKYRGRGVGDGESLCR